METGPSFSLRQFAAKVGISPTFLSKIENGEFDPPSAENIKKMAARLGVSGVLGATWIESQTVMIDESLEPTDNRSNEGRFNFTLAHEIGHWELHRLQICDPPDQPTLFDFQHKPSIVCRSTQSREPNNRTIHTKRNQGLWDMVHSEEFETRAEAMRREKYLKTGFGREWIKEKLSNELGC